MNAYINKLYPYCQWQISSILYWKWSCKKDLEILWEYKDRLLIAIDNSELENKALIISNERTAGNFNLCKIADKFQITIFLINHNRMREQRYNPFSFRYNGFSGHFRNSFYYDWYLRKLLLVNLFLYLILFFIKD